MNGISLQQYDSLPDRLKMHRQSDKRGFLIVEGPSDKRFFDRLTESEWAVFPAGTRANVSTAVRGANALKIERVAGLIDRDFDDFYDDKKSKEIGIYSFPEADLEAVLVRGPWFEKLMVEFCSEEKLGKEGGISQLREIVIGIAGVVGFFRRANALHGWGLNFEELDYTRKIGVSDLQLDIKSLMASISSRLPTPEARDQLQDIKAGIGHVCDRGIGSFRGKDAMAVVVVALKRKFGTTTKADLRLITGALRAAVDSRILEVDPIPELHRVLSSPDEQYLHFESCTP